MSVLCSRNVFIVTQRAIRVERYNKGMRWINVEDDINWKDRHTSLALALVYIMKLIEEPPPKIWAQGTTAFRPASHFDGRDS